MYFVTGSFNLELRMKPKEWNHVDVILTSKELIIWAFPYLWLWPHTKEYWIYFSVTSIFFSAAQWSKKYIKCFRTLFFWQRKTMLYSYWNHTFFLKCKLWVFVNIRCYGFSILRHNWCYSQRECHTNGPL